MNQYRTTVQRILAIDPTSRGFGYAVFEGPELLIDWGLRVAYKDKYNVCLRRVTRLIEQYDPQVIVIEDTRAKNSRRCKRVQELLNGIVQLGKGKGFRTKLIASPQVKKTFADSGASTKEEIAGVLSARYPELLQHLPPHRKCWMSEDVRMSIFDAAALGYAFLNSLE